GCPLESYSRPPAAQHVGGRDDSLRTRPPLPHDDLADRAHGGVADLVRRLDRAPWYGPAAFEPRAMFRLEGRLEGEPQELDVRIHLLVRDLEGAGFFRRDDRLPDLAGDLLGWADGRLRDLAEERHALPVAFALDRFPRPRHEVGLTVARREEPALDEHRDLADRAVFERAERHARDVRREEDLANCIADAR